MGSTETRWMIGHNSRSREGWDLVKKTCEFCGRREHKIALRLDGEVRGYCPKCWDDPSPFAPRQKYASAVVVYDRRVSKGAS